MSVLWDDPLAWDDENTAWDGGVPVEPTPTAYVGTSPLFGPGEDQKRRRRLVIHAKKSRYARGVELLAAYRMLRD